jgi:hypothetical protein
MSNYKIVQDKNQLDHFVETILPDLKPNEKFYITLLARKKHFSPLKSDKGQLKRILATKELLYNKLRQLECPIGLLDFARPLHSFTPLITEIGAVWGERQNNDWDGYSASPINQSSREDAVGFVRRLPTKFIIPEVVPESDGTLALEWQNNDSDNTLIEIHNNIN